MGRLRDAGESALGCLLLPVLYLPLIAVLVAGILLFRWLVGHG